MVCGEPYDCWCGEEDDSIWRTGGSQDQTDWNMVEAAAQLVLLVAALAARPPAQYDTCSAAVQPHLRYGISGRSHPEGFLPVDENETLSEAVCCDSRAMPFAEPQNLYQEPDIALFDKMNQTTTTTFYDSVCGVPVFRTPVGRSLKDFKADTTEHGWPSFRNEEVFKQNVVTNTSTGFVTSVCGTHLGSYLPDSQGPRWCIDLSCISGSLM